MGLTIKDFTIKEHNGTKYIEQLEILEKLGKVKSKQWLKYFLGQTGILTKGKLGIYPYDLERFFNGLPTMD